ncbi:MAG: hypothetical protein ACRC46_13545 [Thermoguttaceae bacterium]
MKRSFCFALVSVSLLVFAIGCGEHEHSADDGHGHAPAPAPAKSADDAHAALHATKYNEVLVEFPGHKYAMEIIDEKETTGLVTAFLTDAHFDPCEVDAQEVRLNFVVGGQPKVFTLTRSPQEAGKPATFTLTDAELAALNCEGWEGNAMAIVEISGVPYQAPLKKTGQHDHEGHSH